MIYTTCTTCNIEKSALYRAKSFTITVEDPRRLFGKVDTAAPDKAVPVMRISRVRPYLSEFLPVSLYGRGRMCYINASIRNDNVIKGKRVRVLPFGNLIWSSNGSDIRNRKYNLENFCRNCFVNLRREINDIDRRRDYVSLAGKKK